MIRINMLDVGKQKLNAAVAKALAAIRARSYSGRNPQLGRMINCPICDRRHRGSICEPHYAVGRYDPDKKPLIANQLTARGVLGKHSMPKRYHPHPNHKGLLLVQRTQFIYPQFELYISDPVECMKASRKEAARQLREEDKIRKRIKRLLLKGGATYRWGFRPRVGTEARTKRQTKQALRTAVNAMMKEVEDGLGKS